jgi:hypothetical protein
MNFTSSIYIYIYIYILREREKEREREATGAPSMLRLIRKTADLAGRCPTFDLNCEENTV